MWILQGHSRDISKGKRGVGGGGVHTVSHPGYRLDCQVNFAAEFHRRNDIVLDENRVRMGGVGGWRTCLQKSCMDEYVNWKR